MTKSDDVDELMIAFDEWEAAADAVDLLMVDRARGLAVDLEQLEHARRTLAARQAKWGSLASSVQPIVRRQASSELQELKLHGFDGYGRRPS